MQWLPGALQEQGVLPGILTCCHALAHSGDRCVAPCRFGQAMLLLYLSEDSGHPCLVRLGLSFAQALYSHAFFVMSVVTAH